MSKPQEWFYSCNGKQVGPVAAADLKRLASTGGISPSDLIWKDGWTDWKPAGSIKGLFADALPSRPVPPPLPVATDAKASTATGADSSSGVWVPLWQRIPVAAFLTVCCFPVGLYLVWYNPRITQRTKWIWIGGFASLMVLGMTVERVEHEAAKAELAAATQLWDAGDKPAAISKYREVIKSHLGAVPKSDRSLIMGRVVDFDAEAGNVSSVQELLEKAETANIVPSVSSDKTRSLIASYNATKKEAEAIKSFNTTTDSSQDYRPSYQYQQSRSPSLHPSDERVFRAMRDAGTDSPEAVDNVRQMLEYSRELDRKDRERWSR